MSLWNEMIRKLAGLPVEPEPDPLYMAKRLTAEMEHAIRQRQRADFWERQCREYAARFNEVPKLPDV